MTDLDERRLAAQDAKQVRGQAQTAISLCDFRDPAVALSLSQLRLGNNDGKRSQTLFALVDTLAPDVVLRSTATPFEGRETVAELWDPQRGGVRARTAPLPASALEPLGSRLASACDPESIARKATEGVRSGKVILLHGADHYSAPRLGAEGERSPPHILEELASEWRSLVAMP